MAYWFVSAETGATSLSLLVGIVNAMEVVGEILPICNFRFIIALWNADNESEIFFRWGHCKDNDGALSEGVSVVTAILFIFGS